VRNPSAIGIETVAESARGRQWARGTSRPERPRRPPATSSRIRQSWTMGRASIRRRLWLGPGPVGDYGAAWDSVDVDAAGRSSARRGFFSTRASRHRSAGAASHERPCIRGLKNLSGTSMRLVDGERHGHPVRLELPSVTLRYGLRLICEGRERTVFSVPGPRIAGGRVPIATCCCSG